MVPDLGMMRGAGLCRGGLVRDCCYSAATRRERTVDHFGVNSRQTGRVGLPAQVSTTVAILCGLARRPRLLYFVAVAITAAHHGTIRGRSLRAPPERGHRSGVTGWERASDQLRPVAAPPRGNRRSCETIG